MASSEIILPNLIIGGSPKCGTSSLFFWLKDHPEICASNIKETGFMLDGVFSFNKKANYVAHGLEKYAELFPDYKGEKVVMEATPSYLVQAEAPFKCIEEFEKKPHVIFIFRKPSERIFSDYNFKKNSQKQLEEDMIFADFLGSKQGEHSKKITRYAAFLENWNEQIGKENITVFILEELKKSPREYLIEVSNKVGIDASFWNDYNFDAKNQTVNINNARFHQRITKISNLIPSFVKKSKLKTLYYNINSKKTIVKEDSTLEKKQLDREFETEVEKLEQLLGREIPLWR